MKLEGRWQYAPLVAVVAVVGISGFIEAGVVSESVGDLLIDAGIIATIVLVSILAARLLARRRARQG